MELFMGNEEVPDHHGELEVCSAFVSTCLSARPMRPMRQPGSSVMADRWEHSDARYAGGCDRRIHDGITYPMALCG